MGGKAPKAPDPEKTASSQFDYNVGAGLASGIINNPNINNPYGSVSYKQAGTETIQLPNGQKVQVPRYTQTSTLNPTTQKQFDQRNDIINQLLGQTGSAMSQNPTAGAPKWQTGYGVGNLKTGFKTGQPTVGYGGIDTTQQMYNAGFKPTYGSQDIQTDYAPDIDFSEDRKRVEEAMMARSNELLGKNRESEVARLAAMGLAPGSEKYGRVSDQFERSANDLALQAVLAGGDEQSRLLGEARARAGFGNEAIGQAWNMDMGGAQFARDTVAQNNTARQASAQMEMSRREMENARRRGDAAAYNQALEAYNNAQVTQTQLNRDKAGFSNQSRQAMVQELLGLQGNKLNQLLSLMTGTQQTNPNAPSFQGQGVNAPDYSGLVSNNYTQQVGQYNNMMSGFAGLGGIGLKALLGGF